MDTKISFVRTYILYIVTIVLISISSFIYAKIDPSEETTAQETSIHPGWYALNRGQRLSKPKLIDKFRTITNQLGATENAKIPKKSPDIVRIATYNVHFWRNPYGEWGTKDRDDFYKIVRVIRRINADILLLQEVGGGPQSWDAEFRKAITELGYSSFNCCSIAEQGVDQPGNLYNCILSKYPLTEPAIKKQYETNPTIDKEYTINPEQRCFVQTTIQLPNNKIISVYNTHLEVRPITVIDPNTGQKIERTPEGARRAQIQELITHITNNDQNSNIIIGADFNTARKQDLQSFTIWNKTLWDVLQASRSAALKERVRAKIAKERLVSPQPIRKALDYLAQQGYRDSFSMSQFPSPQFTTWSGTRIDFLFLGPTWNLPIEYSAVFYDWASDHIPVILDLNTQ